MKKRIVLSVSFFFMFFLSLSVCQAEIIYLASGGTKNAKVLYRDKGSIWIKQRLGSIGILRQEITKIEDEDGSISKYDYESLTTGLEDYIKQKKYIKAIKLCNKLLETFPDENQLHHLRGNLTRKVEDFKTAIEDYNFLIRNMAADAEIFNNLGSIYAKNKEYIKADDLFRKAIAQSPDLAEAHFNLAELLFQNKDYVNAISEYEKAISINPQDTQALYKLGQCQNRLGVFEK